MKGCSRSGGVALLILNTGDRYRREGKTEYDPGWPPDQSGYFGEDINLLLLTGFKT
jgi:hypothetical protein